MNNAEKAAYILANLAKLPEKDRAFAESMATNVEKADPLLVDYEEGD